MTEEWLSKNEKITLYGLVRLPAANDRQLSGLIGLRLSTVTAIRNRLMGGCIVRPVRIPYLERAGAELLAVCFTRLNPLMPREGMARVLKEVAGGTDEMFYAFADQFGMMSFFLCRNFSDAWNATERAAALLADRGALSPDFSRQDTALFPLDQTRFLRFFDFSRLLWARFGPGLPEPAGQPNLKAEKAAPRRMSRLEKRVYLGLTRYPALSDIGVGQRIGVSRQTVSKLRKRFLSERLLVLAQVPDFLGMGAGMISVLRQEFAPGVSMSMRRKGIEWSLRELPAFFHLASGSEGIMILLENSFEDLQRHMGEAARYTVDKGLLKKDPCIVNFAVRDIFIVKDLNFAPAVKRILGVNEKVK